MIIQRFKNTGFIALNLAVFLMGALPAISSAQDISNTAAFSSNTNDILNNPLTPSLGNSDADVTIIEFYDYLCPYCKDEEAGLEQLLQEDSNIKIIYKVAPKHGPLSVRAAIASLASVRQGTAKYLSFHQALMSKDTPLTSEDMLYQIANSVGLDVNKLKQDMADPSFARQVQDNIAIGQGLGVRIIPTFIIGGYLFPGDSGHDKLKQMVDYIRSNKKSN